MRALYDAHHRAFSIGKLTRRYAFLDATRCRVNVSGNTLTAGSIADAMLRAPPSVFGQCCRTAVNIGDTDRVRNILCATIKNGWGIFPKALATGTYDSRDWALVRVDRDMI